MLWEILEAILSKCNNAKNKMNKKRVFYCVVGMVEKTTTHPRYPNDKQGSVRRRWRSGECVCKMHIVDGCVVGEEDP